MVSIYCMIFMLNNVRNVLYINQNKKMLTVFTKKLFPQVQWHTAFRVPHGDLYRPRPSAPDGPYCLWWSKRSVDGWMDGWKSPAARLICCPASSTHKEWLWEGRCKSESCVKMRWHLVAFSSSSPLGPSWGQVLPIWTLCLWFGLISSEAVRYLTVSGAWVE